MYEERASGVAFCILKRRLRGWIPYCCPQLSHGGLSRGGGGRLLSETCTVGTRGNRNTAYWEMCFHHEGGQALGHVHRAPVPKAHPRRCSEVVGRGPEHPDLVGPAWLDWMISHSPFQPVLQFCA